MIYSLVETAKENGINPYIYLTFLLEQLPNIDVKDHDALDKLLPWSECLPPSCRGEKADELPISNSGG
jgi:transposase